MATTIYSEFIWDWVYDDSFDGYKYVDHTDDCILAVHMETRKALFYYKVNDDLIFTFHLLWECGEPYRIQFEKMLEENKLVLITMDTKEDYYEIITNI